MLSQVQLRTLHQAAAALRAERLAEIIEICRQCPVYFEAFGHQRCHEIAAQCGCGGGGIPAWVQAGHDCPRRRW